MKIHKNTTHGFSKHPLYSTWVHLKDRCDNPNNRNYHNYGGRGIQYTKRWKLIELFIKDMEFKYVYAKKKFKTNQLTIERENVNGNYCFENCIFIPRNKQLENTRKNKWFIATNIFSGKQIKEKNIRAFARKYKIDNSAITKCLKGISYHRVGIWEFEYCG